MAREEARLHQVRDCARERREKRTNGLKFKNPTVAFFRASPQENVSAAANLPVKFSLDILGESARKTAAPSSTPLKFSLASLHQQQSARKSPAAASGAAAHGATPLKFSLDALRASATKSARGGALVTPPHSAAPSAGAKQTPESVVKKFALASLLDDDMDESEFEITEASEPMRTPPTPELGVSVRAAGNTPVTSALLRHFESMDESEQRDQEAAPSGRRSIKKLPLLSPESEALEDATTTTGGDLMAEFVYDVP